MRTERFPTKRSNLFNLLKIFHKKTEPCEQLTGLIKSMTEN